MKSARVSIGSIRRREIVDAAWAIIAEQGLQNLSLSEIEKKVRMSRGQLTYYYKSKEDILLAVFDRMMEQWRRRGRPGDGDPSHPLGRATWEEAVAWILRSVVLGCDDKEHFKDRAHFHALHYTFLSQVSHRADFRQRLARLYDEWRRHMTTHLSETLQRRPTQRHFSPRALASLVQAMINGLAVQAAVDPKAMGGEEVVALCLDMLENYLWPRNPRRRPGVSRKPSKNGHSAGERSAPASLAARALAARAARTPSGNGRHPRTKR